MNELPDTPEGMLRFMQQRSVEASPFAKFLGIEIVRCWNGEAESYRLSPRRKRELRSESKYHIELTR